MEVSNELASDTSDCEAEKCSGSRTNKLKDSLAEPLEQEGIVRSELVHATKTRCGGIKLDGSQICTSLVDSEN